MRVGVVHILQMPLVLQELPLHLMELLLLMIYKVILNRHLALQLLLLT